MPVADTQLQNLIKITKVRKERIANITDVLRRRLCLQQPAPACSLTDVCVTMLSDSQACELCHFVFIVQLRHNEGQSSIHSACNCACFQSSDKP